MLERCLESLVGQSFRDFEVLVCDDGSTDNTAEVIAKFLDKLDLKYFKLQNWGGPARPRNIGINNSSGEWVCFLDSDDFWVCDKLKVINGYLSCDYDFFYHQMYCVKDQFSSSNTILPSRKLKSNGFKDLLINGNVICNSSVVVRRSIILEIGGINESKEMVGCEDYNAWLKVLLITPKVKFIPEILGYYYMHVDGISRKDMSDKHMFAINEFLEYCTPKEKLALDAHILYMRSSFKFHQLSRDELIKNYIFCIKNGMSDIRFKSFYLLLKSFVK